MKNNIKRIWCQCCDDGDNENCDIQVSIDEPYISINFNSELVITYSQCEQFDCDDVLVLSDIKSFLENVLNDSAFNSTFLGDCYNIEDETSINIEFDDGKIFEDDIVNALRYLISTNNETEST